MGKTGSGTSSITECSPKRKIRRAKARKNEEKRWAEKSGEVITRKVGDPKTSPPPPRQGV